jgi:hypothetical protein
MQTNYNKVNEALESLNEVPWITKEDRVKIIGVYGVGILNIIDEICSFSANDIIWTSLSYDEAFIESLKRLSANYPYLTDMSVRRVANLAAYFWK